MQNQSFTNDSLMHMLDSSFGLSSDAQHLKSPATISANKAVSLGGSSPGQCLISISNYNFFTAVDPKNLMPSSLNVTNNYGIQERSNQMPKQDRLAEGGLQSHFYDPYGKFNDTEGTFKRTILKRETSRELIQNLCC